MLTADVVNQADYIFGMTHSHVDAITLLYPHAAEKTFLLREFDETLESYENDISDPIGRLLRSLPKLPRPNRTRHRIHAQIHRTNRVHAHGRPRHSPKPLLPLALTTADSNSNKPLNNTSKARASPSPTTAPPLPIPPTILIMPRLWPVPSPNTSTTLASSSAPPALA
jgi:hypothetical protein